MTVSLLRLLAPDPFPLPSEKVATQFREKTRLFFKGQGFPVEEKEWEMNYFRPKAIIF